MLVQVEFDVTPLTRKLGDRWAASAPDWPGIFGWGNTEAEAAEGLREQLALRAEAAMDRERQKTRLMGYRVG